MTQKTAHTPGPWKCKPGFDSDLYYCLSNIDGNILTFDDDEHEANARLIAAAPETAAERDRLKEANAELLQALREIGRELAYPNNEGQAISGLVDRQRIARAAIAKAEGK